MNKKMKMVVFILLFLLFVVACSPKSIDTTVKQRNEGYILGNGSTAVLLTHGLSSSPYEEKYLADYLAGKNITVYVLRLPGHGTSLEDLDRTKWEDWYKSYKESYFTLKENHEEVYVGGMSLGGILALKLAEDEQVDGVIVLAPAVMLDDERSNYAWLFKYLTKYSSRNLSNDVKFYNYDKFSVASVAESVELAKITEKDFAKITEPVFIMQYKQDYRVKPESSQIVYDSVSSAKKELDWIEGSGHVMITAPEKEQYFDEIYRFIRENP